MGIQPDDSPQELQAKLSHFCYWEGWLTAMVDQVPEMDKAIGDLSFILDWDLVTYIARHGEQGRLKVVCQNRLKERGEVI